MFENLSEKLDKAFKIIKGNGKITEINISESIKEVRKALIEADVSYPIAKEFCDEVKKKALGQNVLTSVEPGQMMIKMVHDELVSLMGSTTEEINIKPNPTIILNAGLQGSGKTTFSGKLALYLKSKKSKKVLLVAADVYRPAAINQLQVLADSIQVDVFRQDDNKNPVDIALKAVQKAKAENYNVVIIDTAGRLAVDEQMMTEIADIKNAVNPTETLFVVDSMTGQDAVNTAKAFYDRLNYDGVVLTKLDGDTRGGAALTIRRVVSKPIKFVSIGEKLDALDIFHPDRMANRILGMGDIVSLVERAQEHYDAQEARKLSKKIHNNTFDYNDFLAQINQIKKMGNLKDLVGMIPGVGKALKDVEINDDAFKSIEAIIGSMTKQERANPDIIDVSRKNRIAKGSGCKIEEVNRLIKQFDQTRKMMRSLSGGKMQQLKQMRNMKKIARR